MSYYRKTSETFSKHKENVPITTSSADKDIEQSSSGAEDYIAQPQRAVVDDSVQEVPIQQEPIKGSERNIDQRSTLTHQDELQGGHRGHTPVWAKMPTEEVPPAHAVQASRKSQSQIPQSRKSLVDDARTLPSVHRMPPLPAAGCFDLDAPGNAPIITGYDHDHRSVTAKIADNVAANHRHSLHVHQMEHAAVGSAVGGTAAGAAAYAAGGAAAGIAGGAAVGAAAGGIAAGGIMSKCMDYLRGRESIKTDQDWDDLVSHHDSTQNSKLDDQDWKTKDNKAKLNTLGEEGYYTPSGEQVLHSPAQDSGIRHRQAYSTNQDDIASDRAVIDDDVNQQPEILGGNFDHSQDVANGKSSSTTYSYTRGSSASDDYYGRSIDQPSASHDTWTNGGRQGNKGSYSTGVDTAIGAGSGAAFGAATASAIHHHNAPHQTQSSAKDSSMGPSSANDMTMHNDMGMSGSSDAKRDARKTSFEDQRGSTFGSDQDKSARLNASSKRKSHDRNMSNQTNPFQDSKNRQSLDQQNYVGPSNFLFDESQGASSGKQAPSSSTKQDSNIGASGLGSSGPDKYADYERQKSATADRKAFDDIHPASNGFNDQEDTDRWNTSKRNKSVDQDKISSKVLPKANSSGDADGVHEPTSTPRGSKSSQSKYWGAGLGIGGAAAAAAAVLSGNKSQPKEPKSTADDARVNRHLSSQEPEDYASPYQHDFPSQGTTQRQSSYPTQSIGQEPIHGIGQSNVKQADSTGQPLDQEPITGRYETVERGIGQSSVKQADSTGQPLDQEPVTGRYATVEKSGDQQTTDHNPVSPRVANVSGQPLDQEPVSGEYATVYGRSGIGRYSMDNDQSGQKDTSKHSTGINPNDEQVIPEGPISGDQPLIEDEHASPSGQQSAFQQSGSQHSQTQQQPNMDIIDDVAHGGLRDTAAQKSDNVPATHGLKEQAKEKRSSSKPWGIASGLGIGGAAGAAAAGAVGGRQKSNVQSEQQQQQQQQQQQKQQQQFGQQQRDQRQRADSLDDARTGQQLGTDQQPSDDYSRRHTTDGPDTSKVQSTDKTNRTSDDQLRSSGQRYSEPHVGPVSTEEAERIYQKKSNTAATGVPAASRASTDAAQDHSTEKRAMPDSLEGATGGVDDDALGVMESRKKSGVPENPEQDQVGAVNKTAQQGQSNVYTDKNGNQIPSEQLHGNTIFVDQHGNRIAPDQVQKNATFVDQNGHPISSEQMRKMSLDQQQQEQLLSGGQQQQEQPLSGGQQQHQGAVSGDQYQQPSSMGQDSRSAPYAAAGATGAAGAAGAAGATGATGATGAAHPAGNVQFSQGTQSGQSENPTLQDYVDGKIENRRASFKESIGKIFHRSSLQKNAEAEKANAKQKIEGYNAIRRASKEGAGM